MQADFILDYAVMTLERPQKLYLLARFIAGAAPHDAQRRPLNLSLVIDHSGSMAGAKMDYTRQAARFLVQHLSPRDTFSIVLYSDVVETLVPPEKVVNKDSIAHLLDSIRVRGTTNLSGGWLQGCQYVANHLDAQALNRVILMTDGLANRGVTDQTQLVGLARQKYGEGVSTTTMGLGEDFNEDLLIAMADGGGGAFYFIESPEVAPQIFQEELRGLLNVVGQNLTIRIDPSTEVAQVRQMNVYPTQEEGRSLTLRLGDIYGSEVKTAVLELSIPALHSLGEMQIAELTFEYDAIVENATQHFVERLPVHIHVSRADGSHALPNPAVAQSVLLLKAAQARQDAVQAADKGNYMGASQVLRSVAHEIEQSGVQNDALQEERRALLEQAERMSEGAAQYDSYSRKTMVTQSRYTSTGKHEDTMMLRMRERERQSSTMNPNSRANTVVPSEPVPPQPGVPPTHVRVGERLIALQGDVMRIGRSEQNEIVVDEHGVSRVHAQLRHEADGRWVIEDMNSTNGTSVGGQRLSAPHALSVGDVAYVCDSKLVFLRAE